MIRILEHGYVLSVYLGEFSSCSGIGKTVR